MRRSGPTGLGTPEKDLERQRLAKSQAAGIKYLDAAEEMNVVANKCEYIERLRLAIEHLQKCHATHAQGEVEVFKLTGHVRALRCYAWIYEDDSGEHIATVLAVLPVKSAVDAVRGHIAGEIKKARK